MVRYHSFWNIFRATFSMYLNHEARDYAMKDAALVVQLFAACRGALLSRTESTKILGCLGNNIISEGENNTARLFGPDANVKEHFGPLRRLCK